MQHDLPTDWSVRSLEKVAILQRGFDLPIQMREEGEIPVYGSNGIDGWHSHSAVSGPGVITGRSGTIGSVYLEPRDYWPLNTTLYVRNFHGNDPRFVARMLESLDLKRFAASTGVPSLNRNFVHPTPVLLPPLDEQSRIAVVLDTVDEAIAKTEAAIAKLTQMHVGLLHDLLTRGLDENGQLRNPVAHPEQFQHSPLGRIPRDWKTEKLAKLTTLIVDGVHHTPRYIDRGVPFLTAENLTKGVGISLNPCRYISEASHAECRRRVDVRSGDVLVSKDGTLGIARVVPDGFPDVSIFVSVALLRPESEAICPELVREFFDTNWFSRQLGQLSAGTGLRHIHLEHFREFLLPVPPLEEQRNVAKVIEQFDGVLASENQDLGKLLMIKSGLMSDLLTGRVRVPEGIAVAP